VLGRAFSIAIVAGLLALVAAAPATAAPAVSGEFSVPGLGSNNKLVEGPDGNMWVTTGGGGKDVARITPAGEVKEFNLEAVTPSGIAVGPEGKLWITRNGAVISFSPADPEGSKTLFAIAEIGTQHSIVRGPDNNLWVATNDKVLRIPPSDPTKFTKFEFPGLAPKDIDTAGSLLVIADFKRILALNTAGAVADEHKILNQSQGGGRQSEWAVRLRPADRRATRIRAAGAGGGADREHRHR
jgi:streptogramin lyase